MPVFRSITTCSLLVPILLCASCDSRQPTPPSRPSAAVDDPFVKPAPAPVEESGEPNWQDRYQSLKRDLALSFGAPRIGDTLTVKLKSGTERQGVLTRLSDNEVTLAFDMGEVSYPRAGLSAETRAELFADDYAHLRAGELVQRERDAYLQESAEPEVPVNSARPSSRAPVNDPSDQSVWQVKAYLEDTLKDPDTIRYQEWSPVMKTDRGYQVVCTYQARAGSFGMVTEKKVFHMTPSGDVTAASAVRRNLRK